MGVLPVAAVQLDIVWENPTANLAHAAILVQEAANAGARLVVLPEMFATGFSVNYPSLKEGACPSGGVPIASGREEKLLTRHLC